MQVTPTPYPRLRSTIVVGATSDVGARRAERSWPQVAPSGLNHLQVYGAWTSQDANRESGVFLPVETVDDLRRNPAYQVVTPDECRACRTLGPAGRAYAPPDDGWPPAGARLVQPGTVRTGGAAPAGGDEEDGADDVHVIRGARMSPCCGKGTGRRRIEHLPLVVRS